MLRTVRRALIRYPDPVLVYGLQGHPLRLPLSHDLPLIRKEHPDYLMNLVRVAARVFAKYPTGTAIDIGANVGDTAILIRSVAEVPILCVEGDPVFARFLARNVSSLPDVELEESFVGGGEKRLVRAHREKGTTRIVVDDKDGVPTVFVSLLEILERHPAFENPVLLKVDTDGWDCTIVSSERAFLTETGPVVFFEYEPEARPKVSSPHKTLDDLQEAGYRFAIFYANTGAFMSDVFLGEDGVGEKADRLCGEAPGGYCDIAAFHEKDEDVFEALRREEEASSQRHHVRVRK